METKKAIDPVEKAKELEKERMRSKLKFALHLDQTMSHYERFYREDIKEAEVELSKAKASDNYPNRKAKAETVKFHKEYLERLKKSVLKFKKVNYGLQEVMEENMQEESVDRLQGVADIVDTIIDGLFNPDTNLEMGILLTMFDQGVLDETIEKVKKEQLNIKSNE